MQCNVHLYDSWCINSTKIIVCSNVIISNLVDMTGITPQKGLTVAVNSLSVSQRI